MVRVKDTLLKKELALKIIQTISPSAGDTIINEFKTLSGLNHPNLVQVYDFGILQSDQPYFSMELIEGQEINKFLGSRENIKYLLSITHDILSALSYLHSLNILHGDIKPENIMIVKDRRGGPMVKILDFGLSTAATISSGKISGTLRFMAPEVLKKAAYSPSSDLYALGVTLIESITGNKYPDATKINDAFLSPLYSSLNKVLSKSGIKTPFTLSSFLLDMVHPDPRERINTAKSALEAFSILIDELERGDQAINRGIFIDRENEILKIEKLLYGDSGINAIILEGARGVGKKSIIKKTISKAQLEGYLVLDLSLQMLTHKSLDKFIEVISENLSPAERKQLLSSHKRIISSSINKKDSTKTPKKSESLLIFDNIIQYLHKISLRQKVLICIPDIDLIKIDFIEFIHHLIYESNFLGSKLFTLISKNIEAKPSKIQSSLYEKITLFPHVYLITIPPFDLDQTSNLIHELFSDELFSKAELKNLHSRTKGLPHLLMELFQLLISNNTIQYIEGHYHLDRKAYRDQRLPGALGTLFKTSLASLSPREREVLQAIALYEKEMPLDLLARILESDIHVTRAKINLLLEKKLININAEGFLDLNSVPLRQYVQKQISKKKREKISLSIARVLEEIEPENFHVLAKHYINAGVPEKAVEYGLNAAKELISSYEYYDGLSLLTNLKKLIIDSNYKSHLVEVFYLLAAVEKRIGLSKKAIINYIKTADLTENHNLKALVYKEIALIHDNIWGKIESSRNYYKKALKHARITKDPVIISEILLCWSEIESKKRIIMTEKAAKLAKSVDLNMYARALSKLCYLYKISGRLKDLDSTLREIDKLTDKISIETRKEILFQLATIYFFAGQYTEANKYALKKYSLDKRTQDEFGMISSLRITGGISYVSGLFHDTINTLIKALFLVNKFNIYLSALGFYFNLSLAYRELAEFNKSLAMLEKGNKIIRTHKIKQVNSVITNHLMNINLILGDIKKEEYIYYYEKTRQNALKYQNMIRYGHSQLSYSKYYFQKGIIKKALKYILKANDAFSGSDAKDDIVETKIYIALYSIEADKIEDAAKNLKEARTLFDEIHCYYLKPRLLFAEGCLARVQNNPATLQILEKALRTSKKMGTREVTWQIQHQIALYHKDKGDLHKALGYYRESMETIRQITESIEGEELKLSYLSVPFRKKVFNEIKALKHTG